MNLELLDPFGRQTPDRVDATLSLPPSLHFRHHDVRDSTKNALDQEWKAAYHVAFNRRGTYLAVGYGSGAVGVHNVLSRGLCALYRSDDPNVSPTHLGNGITSVTWSRRSRTLLAGAAGDSHVMLFDNTHPYGPEESCLALYTEDGKDPDGEEGSNNRSLKRPPESNDIPPIHTLEQTTNTSFKDPDVRFTFIKERRKLTEIIVDMGHELDHGQIRTDIGSLNVKGLLKYPYISFSFPHPVGGSLQVNPRIPTAGLAALTNGSLMLFYVHPSVWIGGDGYPTPRATTVPLWDNTSHFITCAAFDPRGQKVYAATKDGALLGFDVSELLNLLMRDGSQPRRLPIVKPHMTVSIPGSSSAWHLLVSRNGKYLVINSADGTLRLYSTQECWEHPEKVEKPKWVFQDVVSKVKFASCDLSGDGEYVVGGANGDDNKYELYIWNTSTGALMDKLTGPSVQLYSVAWHPTRSFLAVATSDGLVDLWGPRINWTAFAPDFQALPQNVEYIEREDEFDIDEQGAHLADNHAHGETDDKENSDVDVLTIKPVPVFASDSEDEREVFDFETKVTGGRIRGAKAAAAAGED